MKKTTLQALDTNTLFRFAERSDRSSASVVDQSTVYEVFHRTHDAIFLLHSKGTRVVFQGQKAYSAQVHAF